MTEIIKGVVTRSTGSWYDVEMQNGEKYQCRIVGKFRLGKLKITNPVAVGDHVKVRIENAKDKIGNIIEIEDRNNYVLRQSPRKKHQLHILASNIDQAILIVTIENPKLKHGFIDRFLLMTEPYNIPVTIVFNKKDIYSLKSLELYEQLEAVYETIGYNCILVSAKTGEGLEELESVLRNNISLIGGQSGVGKSTIVNAIEDDLDLKTTELSDFTGKGQHTTTFAEMHKLSHGGAIIDTPGIKTLGFSHLEPMDVAHNFKEIFKASKNCKFYDCLHRDEPKCAVLQAVEEGEISYMRYKNYIQILFDIEEQNYWERHSDV